MFGDSESLSHKNKLQKRKQEDLVIGQECAGFGQSGHNYLDLGARNGPRVELWNGHLLNLDPFTSCKTLYSTRICTRLLQGICLTGGGVNPTVHLKFSRPDHPQQQNG
eukprot:scaffold2620_cov18-Tisochrysis_lutea.AAC.1